MVKKRLFYLDFVRAIALIIIVLFHYNYHFINTYKISGVHAPFYLYANGSWAGIGVALFFIISGAALMYNYESNIDLKKFYKKRIKSIFPMFWIAYLAVFLLEFYSKTSLPDIPKWRIIFSIMGMDGYFLYIIPNFYILGEWFLGAIIIFYVIFPLLRKLIINIPCIIIIVSSLLVLAVVYFNPFQILLERNIIICIYECMLGMYFSYYIKKANIKLSISGFLLFIFCLCFEMKFMPSVLCDIIAGGALFLCLSGISGRISSHCIINFARILSKYSYSIFLVHHVILLRVMTKFTNKSLSNSESLSLVILVLVLIITCSVLLYKFNEYIMKSKSCFTKSVL